MGEVQGIFSNQIDFRAIPAKRKTTVVDCRFFAFLTKQQQA